MTTPQLTPTSSNANRHCYIGVAAVVLLSIVAVGGGAESSNAQPSLQSATAAPTTAQTRPASRLPTREPQITFVDEPTPKARETITWAVDRYRRAGLQLPDLKISFPASCGGKAALYHVGQKSIDFCFNVKKNTVLHEFAHAWDDTSGAVDRQAFMDLRGLKVWWGGTKMPSSEQGAEQLAQIIAWGLMDGTTRGVPQIPANTGSELTTAFVMLTGGIKPPQPTPYDSQLASHPASETVATQSHHQTRALRD